MRWTPAEEKLIEGLIVKEFCRREAKLISLNEGLAKAESLGQPTDNLKDAVAHAREALGELWPLRSGL